MFQISAGLDARLIETSNGEQSFCFLMSGQNEIIGTSKSSFVRWASYLGNASKARIYSLRSPERLARRMGKISFNHNNSDLMRKFSYESYTSEEQDLIDQSRLPREWRQT